MFKLIKAIKKKFEFSSASNVQIPFPFLTSKLKFLSYAADNLFEEVIIPLSFNSLSFQTSTSFNPIIFL